MLANVRPSVVRMSVIRCSSHSQWSYISKTDQERPIDTEHTIEVGIADSVAAFRSSPDAEPCGDIVVSNKTRALGERKLRQGRSSVALYW